MALDPSDAAAYGMAAWIYFWRKINGWMADRPQEASEGARLARRAVELGRDDAVALTRGRSEEHTSELQSLMRISYAVFCLKKKKYNKTDTTKRYTQVYRIRTHTQ